MGAGEVRMKNGLLVNKQHIDVGSPTATNMPQEGDVNEQKARVRAGGDAPGGVYFKATKDGRTSDNGQSEPSKCVANSI